MSRGLKTILPCGGLTSDNRKHTMEEPARIHRSDVVQDQVYSVEMIQDDECKRVIGSMRTNGTRVRRWSRTRQRFTDEYVTIPEHAKVYELTPYQRRHYLNPPVPVPTFAFPTVRFLRLDMYVRENNLGMTMADIMRLKPGEEIKVLVMDRNLGDVACAKNPANQAFEAMQFFRANWGIYKHRRGLRGTILFA